MSVAEIQQMELPFSQADKVQMLVASNRHLEEENEALREEVAMLRRMLFGKKKRKADLRNHRLRGNGRTREGSGRITGYRTSNPSQVNTAEKETPSLCSCDQRDRTPRCSGGSAAESLFAYR